MAQGLDGSQWLAVPFVENAIRCLRAAHLAGLRVPQDISIAGFDGIALGEDLTPMLSTVAQPNADIGRHGVELLVAALTAREF